ncbi:MAG: preprotein translocase subunit SecG [Oscillospiraceae bacterium]|jgi:preprotein translocase subunit SecG|nr:preprotein translocase subunit SecG [Oscillospiraceae bacterium]
MKTAIIIVDLIVALALIAVVILQSGKSSGLGSAFGGSDTFLSKNKSKSLDSRLSRATKWVATAFILLTIVLNII